MPQPQPANLMPAAVIAQVHYSTLPATYSGLSHIGWVCPLQVLFLAILHHGVLPLDKNQTLAVLNLIWASYVYLVKVLYLGPGDAKLLEQLLNRLFPQMIRQVGFKGWAKKLKDFFQNVRQGMVKKLFLLKHSADSTTASCPFNQLRARFPAIYGVATSNVEGLNDIRHGATVPPLMPLSPAL